MKREFLLLAEDYATKHDISGWWMSEKCDGMRAFYDGGISRGLKATDVPYANTTKDGRFVTPPIATGLWSRYGKVIHAPDFWLDTLPLVTTLDMELWSGRGTFQAMRSICGSLDKGEGWRKVTGLVIDSPGWHAVLQDGEIKNANWRTYLDRSMLGFIEGRTRLLAEKGVLSGCVHNGFGQPDECFRTLAKLHEASEKAAALAGRGPLMWRPMTQTKLPRDLTEARDIVEKELQSVSAAGGEGLILRSSTSPWVPLRVSWILKVKKLSDAEGVVTGFSWGRRTDKMSRHLGRMGALIVTAHTGVRLELSGFTDEERAVRLVDGDPVKDYVHINIEVTDANGTREERRLVPVESVQNEGKDASSKFEAVMFPVGSKVTYTYRDLSVDRVPKEARFLRSRDE